MQGRAVLLHTANAIGVTALSRSLRAAGNEVVLTSTYQAACDLVASSAVDVAVIDLATARDVNAVIEAAYGRRVPVIVVTQEASPAKLAHLCADARLDHVIAVAADASGESLMGGADRRELVITVEKLLRRDLFGIDKYVTDFGLEPTVCALGSVDDRHRLIDDVNASLGAVGVGRRLFRRAAVVIDELVKNAFAHAGSAVVVSYVCDGDRFVVGVTDGAGRLSARDVRRAFAHASDEPTGLFNALVMSSQLIFDIEPGERTEVISVITLGDLGGQGHRHAMHLFVGKRRDGVPELLESPAGSERVQLSHSLRVDLRSELSALRLPGTMPRPVIRPQPRRATTQGNDGRPDAHWFEPVGLDTLKGMLRGSARIESAVAAALRYLASEFDAAVALEIVDGRLVPWLAIGRVADWAKLGSVALPLEAPGQLTQAALHRRPRRLAPRRYATDAGFTRFVAGHARADSLAAPVLVNGTPRLVLVAVGRAATTEVACELLDSVRGELERALERFDAVAGSLAHPRGEDIARNKRAETDEPTLVRIYEPGISEARLDLDADGEDTDALFDGILRAPTHVAKEESAPYWRVSVHEGDEESDAEHQDDNGVVVVPAVAVESAPYAAVEIELERSPRALPRAETVRGDGVVRAVAPRLESAPYSAMEIGLGEFGADSPEISSGIVARAAVNVESAPYALVEVATPGEANVPIEVTPDFSEPYLALKVAQPRPASNVEDAVRSLLGRAQSPQSD